MRILHTQLGRHKCHLVGQSCALLARRVAFSIATIVWHTPLSLSPTVPLSLSLSHCPSSIALPGQPHSALLERNELNALPSTPPHFSSPLFSSHLSVSFCPAVCRSVCPLPLPMPSTTSSTFFSLHFWCFIQHLDGAFECLNSTRLASRAAQSRARDELPRQLSIQSISIQSKLSESICLPSGIPPLPPFLPHLAYLLSKSAGHLCHHHPNWSPALPSTWQTNQLFVF